jgi:hypothetical protein
MLQSEISDPTATGQDAQPKPMFLIQSWHRAYANVLLEKDAGKLAAMIPTAEQLILDRRAQLRDYSIQTDEGLDLRQAFQVLTELRRTSAHADSTSRRHHSLLSASEASL